MAGHDDRDDRGRLFDAAGHARGARGSPNSKRRRLRRRRLTTSNVAYGEAGHRRLVNRRLQIEQQR